MTLNEFIEEIDKLRDRLTGDETVCVGASGGLTGHGHPIKQVYLGFDWDHNKLILEPMTPLTIDAKAMQRIKDARQKAARKDHP